MAQKIILFELNEVPLRVVDEFCRWRPDSTLARCLPRCRQYETFTEDRGHLSPWITWPTLHRGVTNERHFLHDFGQDLTEVDREFPPVWRLLAGAGIATGVFGSLHSYPPPGSFDGYRFYIPDTFAAGSECFPKSVEVFQDFNLRMARDSARNVRRGVPWASALELLAKTPELGLKLSTLTDLTGQLIGERLQQWKTIRRRTYQTVLGFDVFMKQLDTTRPDFSTFFTNHVASSMHRYWAAAFPGDYQTFGYDAAWVDTYSHEIDFTMRKFDGFLTRLLRFVELNPEYTLWITTSMGQAATKALPVETQLYLTDPAKFLSLTGLRNDDWKRAPAMLPQFNLHVSADRAVAVAKELAQVSVAGGSLGFREAANGFFSLDFGHPNLPESRCYVEHRGRRYSAAEAGLTNEEIKDKSGSNAYHIPNGTLLIYNPEECAPKPGRTQISALEVAPAILANFGVPIPCYMRRPFTAGRG